MSQVTAPTRAELKTLDTLGSAGEWELGGRLLRLTNLDKRTGTEQGC